MNELLELLRKRQKDSRNETIMTGIAHGLGQVLSGDTGGAVAGAGVKSMADSMARRRELEDQEQNVLLAQLKAKTGTSGANKPQQYTYLDEKGQVRRGVFQDAEFKRAPTDPLAGFAPKLDQDALGQSYLVSTSGQKKELFPLQKGQLAEKPEKFLQSQLDKYNKRVEKTEDSIKDLNSSLISLGKGGFRDKTAVMTLVKEIETRLSDQDRDFYLYMQPSFARAKEKISSYMGGGHLLPRLISQVQDELNSRLRTANKFKESIRTKYIDQTAAHPAIPWEVATKRFVPMEFTPPAPVESERSRAMTDEEKADVIDQGIQLIKGIGSQIYKSIVGGEKEPTVDDIQNMSDEQLEAWARKRGLMSSQNKRKKK